MFAAARALARTDFDLNLFSSLFMHVGCFVFVHRAYRSRDRNDNCIDDFISRDAFLLQLFFSGALSKEEQLQFIGRQLVNTNELKQRLIDNYNENYLKFLDATDIDEQDRRLHSAVYAHRWGLVKCSEYAKLLETIKNEICG